MTDQNAQATGAQSAANGGAENGNAQGQAQGAAPENGNADGSTLLTEGQEQKTEQKDGQEQKADGEKKDDKPAGAPEEYAEFAAPEGVELDQDLLGEFKPLAKELNLSQENAQKLVDMAAKIVTKQLEAVTAQVAQWAEDARADPEIGGDKLAANLALGKRVIDFAGGKPLRDALNETGVGNHPSLIKAFAKLGALISDDMLERGQPAASEQDPLAKMYPSMAKR